MVYEGNHRLVGWSTLRSEVRIMKSRKHRKILSVAARLISKKSFKGTSLQEIADKVGLHKSTLFHYFKNKEELLLEILTEGVDEVSSNLKKIIAEKELAPEEKLKKAIGSHLALLSEHFDTVNIYLNDFRSMSKKNQPLYLDKRKEYQRNFEKIIVEMKKNGYFKGLDTKIVTFGLLGMLNWTVKWYHPGGSLKATEIGDIFYRMVTK